MYIINRILISSILTADNVTFPKAKLKMINHSYRTLSAYKNNEGSIRQLNYRNKSLSCISNTARHEIFYYIFLLCVKYG